MKALISPKENNRVAQVTKTIFKVALPLHWVDCTEEVKPEWKYVDGNFIEPVIHVETKTNEELIKEHLSNG